MSGLAEFFHKTAAENSNDHQRRDTTVLSYDTSLADLPSATELQQQQQQQQQMGGEDNDDDDDDDDNDDTTMSIRTVPWKSYREWKDWQKEVVKEYMYHRFLRPTTTSNDDENDEITSNHDNDTEHSSKVGGGDTAAAAAETTMEGHEEEGEEETAMFETQQEEDDSQPMFETQPAEVVVAIGGDDDDHYRTSPSTTTQEHHYNNTAMIIPHVRHTFGSTNYVADLDLRTKVLHLARLSLDRIWPLRSTRRLSIKQDWQYQQHQPSITKHHHHHHPLGELLRRQQQQDLNNSYSSVAQQQETLYSLMASCALWHPGEDDGPLAIVYQQVMTMEVSQQQSLPSPNNDHHSIGDTASSPSLVRRQAEAAFSSVMGTVPRRRIKLFLYNAYAKEMQSILAMTATTARTMDDDNDDKDKEKKATPQVVLQLRHVPSHCIFPYNQLHAGSNGTTIAAASSSDWYDAHGDLAPFCVCLGDASNIQYPNQAAAAAAAESPSATDGDDDVDAMRIVRFDEDLAADDGDESSTTTSFSMHVGLVVAKEENTTGSSSSSSSSSATGKCLVLREWQMTAKGLHEVTPEKRRRNPNGTTSSDDDDDDDDENAHRGFRSSTPSVFGDWFIDHKEQERQQQQQAQQRQQSNSTNGGTTTNPTATSAAATAATAAGMQDTQAEETHNNTDEQASPVLVGGRRSIRQSDSDEQEAATTNNTRTFNQPEHLNNRSTNNPAPPLSPPREAEAAAATGGANASRTGESVSSNQTRRNGGGHAPSNNGAHPQGSPSPRKRKLDDEPHYKSLGDLRKILDEKKKVVQADLYGVVLGFGSPSRTKKGEWSMAIALVDESLPEEVGEVRTINLNIFSKQLEGLPQINFAGDVLRAHRVKVQEWKEEIQLMGMRSSSYVVFRGDSNNRARTDNLTVLPTAKNEFSWTDEDKDRSIKLWQWGQRRLFRYQTMKEAQSFKLQEMLWHTDNRTEQYSDSITRGDITLLVTAILEMAPENRSSASPRGFLRVWDGTGPPVSDPFPDGCVSNGSNVYGDPPSAVVERVAEIVRELRHIRQNPSLVEPQAFAGRVANVAIWEDPLWALVKKAVKVGSFIRLRNVHDTRIPNGIRRYLMVFSKSYLTPLPTMTYEVVRMLEAHNDRLRNNDPMNPNSGVLPLGMAQGEARRSSGREGPRNRSARANNNSAVSSVENLASLASHPVPALFSGRARIVGMIPSLSELTRDGLHQVCGSFAIQLSDVDRTPRSSSPLDVILSGSSSAASTLLGMAPSEAMKVQNSQQVLSRLASIVDGTTYWNVKARSIALDGAKYFVLESIETNSG